VVFGFALLGRLDSTAVDGVPTFIGLGIVTLTPSMRRPVGVKMVFVFPIVDLCLNRAASVAILPSAVFGERLSLAASWESLIA
jgi:hypothetical protein